MGSSGIMGSAGINNLLWKTGDPLLAGWWAVRRTNNDPDDHFLYEYWSGAMLGDQAACWSPLIRQATLYGEDHVAKDLAETMARNDPEHEYFAVHVGVDLTSVDINYGGSDDFHIHVESQLKELSFEQMRRKKREAPS